MTSVARAASSARILRHSAWDSLLVLLALVHGGLLLAFPLFPVIAIGIWWNSNTISHQFIHNPFFRSRSLNNLFAAYLSVLLGFPHALWRARHLAHHRAANAVQLDLTAGLVVQTILVLLTWGLLAGISAQFFLATYLPAWILGFLLCSVHGHYEHVRGTTSYYGSIYNLLFFNDGLHVEHHARPGAHWRSLRESSPDAAASRWPPVLRWLENFSLESLERLAFKSPALQRFLLATHERAFVALLRHCSGIRRVGIVGGGLFPRTAIVLRKLLPAAELTIIDLSHDHLEDAKALLPAGTELINEVFDGRRHGDFDLLVFPLSLRGDRTSVYLQPQAQFVCVHDWIWRPRGKSRTISMLLLKRLNLVQR